MQEIIVKFEYDEFAVPIEYNGGKLEVIDFDVPTGIPPQVVYRDERTGELVAYDIDMF